MAARVDLVIGQGETFSFQLNVQTASGDPSPVTGNVSASIAYDYGQNTACSFTVTEVDASNGSFLFTLSDATTSDLDARRGVWDSVLEQDDTTVRLAEGTVEITPRVT